MKQPPWPSLRIVLFKVQKEESVGEILHLQGVVCHAIGKSWEVVCFVIVAMLALVVAGFGAQVRGDAVTGDGAFVDLGHRGVLSVPVSIVAWHKGKVLAAS